MTEAKHTPGPWASIKPSFRWLVYPTAALNDGIDYCVASLMQSHCGEEEAKANANLIAAAPDMLKALHTSEAYIRTFLAAAKKNAPDHDAVARSEADHKIITSAIAKAEGRS